MSIKVENADSSSILGAEGKAHCWTLMLIDRDDFEHVPG